MPGLSLVARIVQPSRDAIQPTSCQAWVTACGPCSITISVIEFSAAGAVAGAKVWAISRRQVLSLRQFRSEATRQRPAPAARSNRLSQGEVAATPRWGSGQPRLSKMTCSHARPGVEDRPRKRGRDRVGPPDVGGQVANHQATDARTAGDPPTADRRGG